MKYFVISAIFLAFEQSAHAVTVDSNDNFPNTRTNTYSITTPGDVADQITDTETMQNIRRALTDDSTLSDNAKNISISVSRGVATISGVVDSYQERDSVANKARNASGVRKVINQVQVKRSY